jgi:putative transposase
MTTPAQTVEGGHARYTFRLRVSSTACRALEAEGDRCRWIWNECVAKSKTVHALHRVSGPKVTCGAAQLNRMLTEARSRTPWLAAGASVPQQQVIRDFAKSRAEALKDIAARVPVRLRAGMPRHKRKREALPSLNYTRRGFRLKDGSPSSSWRRPRGCAPNSADAANAEQPNTVLIPVRPARQMDQVASGHPRAWPAGSSRW